MDAIFSLNLYICQICSKLFYVYIVKQIEAVQ